MGAEVDLAARERVLAALAGGANNTEAARVSGYSRKHVKYLLNDPAFVAELAARRAKDDPDADSAPAIGRRVLISIAQDESMPPSARVNAAKALLAAGVPKARSAARVAAEVKAAEASQTLTPADVEAGLRLLA